MTETELGTIQKEGISRRDVMKRGALVGGAMVWATPVVQSMASPAFAQTGTPKDISYVALCYTCDGNATQCCVKFEFDDDGNVTDCETGNFNTPDCSFDSAVADGCGDCSIFDVSSPDGGQTIEVCFKDTVSGDCEILEGHAVGKCANSCVDGTVSTDKRCATFGMCF